MGAARSANSGATASPNSATWMGAILENVILHQRRFWATEEAGPQAGAAPGPGRRRAGEPAGSTTSILESARRGRRMRSN